MIKKVEKNPLFNTLPIFLEGKLIEKNLILKIARFILVLFNLSSPFIALYFLYESTNDLKLNVISFFLIITGILVITNIFSLVILGIKKIWDILRKRNEKIFPSYKKWNIFLIFFLAWLILYILFDGSYYYKTSSIEGFSNIYDYGRSVKIEGDWDDVSKLADEARWISVDCDQDKMQCEWLTGTVQKWNNGWLTVDKSLFNVTKWDEEKIFAVSTTESIEEEITIYRDACKMTYVKKPTGKENMLGYIPHEMLLTMTANFCGGKYRK